VYLLCAFPSHCALPTKLAMPLDGCPYTGANPLYCPLPITLCTLHSQISTIQESVQEGIPLLCVPIPNVLPHPYLTLSCTQPGEPPWYSYAHSPPPRCIPPFPPPGVPSGHHIISVYPPHRYPRRCPATELVRGAGLHSPTMSIYRLPRALQPPRVLSGVGLPGEWGVARDQCGPRKGGYGPWR
jgi:hypothetical protein